MWLLDEFSENNTLDRNANDKLSIDRFLCHTFHMRNIAMKNCNDVYNYDLNVLIQDNEKLDDFLDKHFGSFD